MICALPGWIYARPGIILWSFGRGQRFGGAWLRTLDFNINY